MKHRRTTKSALCEHTTDKPTHYIHYDRPQILSTEQRFTPRLVREAIEIKKHPNFNREDGWKLSPTWDPIISNLKSTINKPKKKKDTVSAYCTQSQTLHSS